MQKTSFFYTRHANFHLSRVQRRKRNRRTKKNKMTRKETYNELMKRVHRIKKKKRNFIFFLCACGAPI